MVFAADSIAYVVSVMLALWLVVADGRDGKLVVDIVLSASGKLIVLVR